MKYIALFSGGRDSAAMVELLLSKGEPLDYIIFADTLHEFPQMYDYIGNFDKYIQKKYNKHITFTKPRKSFEEWVFGKITRGQIKGWTRGIPMVTVPCFWKRESKVYPIERKIKELIVKDEYTKYIGYTYSELKRSKTKETNVIYPLIKYKKCEADVDIILRDIDMENELYKHFERTGCNFCPFMKKRAFYIVWKFHKDVWEYMKDIENRLQQMEEVANDQWRINETLEELEAQFVSKKIKFGDDAPISCECKFTLQDTDHSIQ